MRCIGAEGAGHSDWSSPVSVDTPPVPGLTASERPSATVALQVGLKPSHAIARLIQLNLGIAVSPWVTPE